MSLAKKNILERIETALEKKTEIPFPEHLETAFAFQNNDLNVAQLFIKEFTALDGNVILCKDRAALHESVSQLATQKNWNNIKCRTPFLLDVMNLDELPYINRNSEEEADAGLTDCECLVARTGTIVLSSALPSGRVLPVYSPVHLVVTSVNNVVFDIADALKLMKIRYQGQLPSALFFASGPSRTADIEKRLVLGVHGPKEVFLFLLETDSIQ
jgi:L-lactate dehydrogenase complex protein LldG